MQRTIITLSICLLTTISSYCQSNYPQKIVVNKDTVVAITVDQLQTANCLLSEREIYKSQLDTAIVFFSKAVDDYEARIKEKNVAIAMQSQQIDQINKLNANGDKQITLLNKKLKIQKGKTFRSTVIGSAIVGLIAATIVALIK